MDQPQLISGSEGNIDEARASFIPVVAVFVRKVFSLPRLAFLGRGQFEQSAEWGDDPQITSGGLQHIIDGSYHRLSIMEQGHSFYYSRFELQAIQAEYRAHPKIMAAIFKEAQDPVVVKGGGIFGIGVETQKMLAVEAVQAIFGADPDKPQVIFENPQDIITGQAVPLSEVLELQGGLGHRAHRTQAECRKNNNGPLPSGKINSPEVS